MSPRLASYASFERYIMRFMVTLVIVAATAYGAILALAFAVQRRIVFQPDTARPHASALAIPQLREVSIRTPGQPPLLAWYLPAPAGRPMIAYFHGNGGNLAYRSDRIRTFWQARLGLMMVEYPGYGGNAGSPSEAGMIAAGRAVLAFLDAQGVQSEQLIFYGESIRSGIATRLATEHPVAGLILESPYTSVLDIARRTVWGRFLPVQLLLRDRFEQLSLIKGVHAPLLIMQGKKDIIVPPDMGRAVFMAANESKVMWSTSEGGHNDLSRYGALTRAIAFADNVVLEKP